MILCGKAYVCLFVFRFGGNEASGDSAAYTNSYLSGRRSFNIYIPCPQGSDDDQDFYFGVFRRKHYRRSKLLIDESGLF